jgi:hypothetical protein
VATPLITGTAAATTPSMVKVTVPVGVPAPGVWLPTAAAKVTGRPTTAGLAEAVSTVVVAVGWTGKGALNQGVNVT